MGQLLISLALVLLLPGMQFAQRRQLPEPKPLAFTHVTVIDVTGGPPKLDMTVVIAGGRIVLLDASAKLTPSEGAQVIDATGKFLIPGLWDMHIHLDDPEIWPTHVSREQKERVFPLLIANGVTGVRDMGGSLEQLQQWKQKVTLGQMLGPRIVAAGPFVDGPSPQWLGSFSVSTEAEARDMVQGLHRRGADFVKLFSGLPRAAFFGVADEAKKLGVVFTGHAQDLVSVAEASDAGQKSIEHGDGIMLACSTEEEAFRKEIERGYAERKETVDPLVRGSAKLLNTYSREKCAALFARFVRNGTWQVPTLYNNWRHAHTTDRLLMDDKRIRYYPKPFREFWRGVSLQDQRRPERLAMLKAHYERLLQLVGDMHRAGVGILAGSDAGANEYSFAGFSLHDELAVFVQAGMTPMEALETATLKPARYLGMTDAFGTVEAGKVADLVLLDANPLDEISNTRKIAAVVVNGRLITKAELRKMLADAESAVSKN